MYRKIVLFCLVIIINFIVGCTDDGYVVTVEDDSDTDFAIVTDNPKKIGVYVCGAVKNPGIYYFDENARIEDAIISAGGVTDTGSLDSLNLADYLSDCDKVYVPTKDEAVNVLSGEVSDGKIDINDASKDQLMTLPGIGESKADSIIQYRTEHGDFSTIEEIQNITGIKEGVYQKIKELIKV